jgi:hypothetical protein
MDLSQFDGLAKSFDEGVEIEIKHPKTGAGTGLKVRVASYEGERVKRVQRKMANAAIRESKRNPKKIGTVEEIEEKALEITAAAVVSWSGFTLNGKPLECTPENVLTVLGNPDLFFIREQIDKAAEDQASFIKA